MANTWGQKLKLSIFGESHGNGIGIVIDGLPPGFEIDMEAVLRELRRRAPGASELATPRAEKDIPEFISGITGGRTTGFPICAIIRNENTRSRDYGTVLRPGHADMTAFIKYKGFADMRGGGHFSGRLTAPLVLAGALAKQILARRGIEVTARIVQIGEVKSEDEGRMKEEIRKYKDEGDSVGGAVEVIAFGCPAGLGEPFFGSVESSMASMFFSVPGVKGVEFGDGFSLASMAGSQANDPIVSESGRLFTLTNHCGGILGGITNGMPIVARVAMKPTPSISKEQSSVDKESGENTTIVVKGRHDPCIVPRAVPVLEAAAALCILDLLLLTEG